MFAQSVHLKSSGTNMASVARVSINNGSASALYGEVSLPATTAAHPIEINYPLEFALPPGFQILVELAANAGWVATVNVGDC